MSYPYFGSYPYGYNYGYPYGYGNPYNYGYPYYRDFDSRDFIRDTSCNRDFSEDFIFDDMGGNRDLPFFPDEFPEEFMSEDMSGNKHPTHSYRDISYDIHDGLSFSPPSPPPRGVSFHRPPISPYHWNPYWNSHYWNRPPYWHRPPYWNRPPFWRRDKDDKRDEEKTVQEPRVINPTTEPPFFMPSA